jgi:hypothetical protein
MSGEMETTCNLCGEVLEPDTPLARLAHVGARHPERLLTERNFIVLASNFARIAETLGKQFGATIFRGPQK